MKLSALVIALFFTASLAGSVTIHGTVFDATLSPVSAIVEIDNPRQVGVTSSNGSYSFSVQPNFNYTLTVRGGHNNSEFEQGSQVTVFNTDVQFDLILLMPQGFDADGTEINETLELLNQPETPLDALDDNVSFPIGWIITAIVLFTGIGVYVLYKSRLKPAKLQTKEKIHVGQQQVVQSEIAKTTEAPKIEAELDGFKRELVKLLKERGGAAEQKELRRELPWSEARVSIELSELEKMGKIKRLKRGRANLVKLT